jgi:hypothetical protein
MGSLAAMQAGSAARYGHIAKDTTRKVAAEGVEALKKLVHRLIPSCFNSPVVCRAG